VQAALAFLIAILCLTTPVRAAKPGSDTQAASGQPPEIHRATVRHADRILELQGIHLITGSAGSPEYPSAVTVGGQPVAIDESASVSATDFSTNRGPLIIPFDSILSALASLATDGALPAQLNIVFKVTTPGGEIALTTYIEQPIVEVSTPEPPPSTGTCPCTPLYDQHYKALYALLWPTCTAPSSSNASLIVPTEQYIEASYIDELRVRYVTISSDSSLSARNSGSNNFANTCSVRTDNDAFLAGPLPVSDEDHAACVADIIAREPICRGGNWLDP
jgi:hypothetical protein